MKILVFSQYYYPERFLVNSITAELVRRGNDVTVITGYPNYPDGEIYQEYKDKKIKFEEIDGVKVYRANIIPRGKNRIKLFFNYMSYAKNAYKVAKKMAGFDIVYCYQLTPVIQLKPAIKYAKKHNLKLVCYCLDLAPLSGSKLMRKFKMLNAYYSWQAKKLYKACDKIAVTSKSFIEYLNKINSVSMDKLVYLPQHAPEELYYSDLFKPLQERKTLMYAGNVGKGIGLKTIVLAVNELKKQGVSGFKIEICGDGNFKKDLKHLVDNMCLNELIEFFDGVAMSDVANVYKRADALLITLRKGQITVPGKLQAYMATGKPIIGALSGSGKDIIEEAKCGICVEAEDYMGLSVLIKEYVNNLEVNKYLIYGDNGKKYFLENFTLKTYVDGLEKILASEIYGDQKTD